MRDRVDSQSHEGVLKLGRRQGSGFGRKFQNAAGEGKKFQRGGLVDGRVLNLLLKSGDARRQSVPLSAKLMVIELEFVDLGRGTIPVSESAD